MQNENNKKNTGSKRLPCWLFLLSPCAFRWYFIHDMSNLLRETFFLPLKLEPNVSLLSVKFYKVLHIEFFFVFTLTKSTYPECRNSMDPWLIQSKLSVRQVRSLLQEQIVPM